jgi:hypothetical protein
LLQYSVKVIMKAVILIFFYSVCCLTAMHAQHASDTLYQKLQKNLHPFFIGQLQLGNLNQPEFKVSRLSTIDNRVHYDAFFCKMELKNRERFHIWIKVHAGQYDNYIHAGEALH